MPPVLSVAEPAVGEPLLGEPDAPLHRIPEMVLQDAWARGLFDADQLVTLEGEPVRILDPGALNTVSGPDFSGARLQIGAAPDALVWAGDVEIHRTSGEWELHGHHEDPAYDRVVLHVVLSPDRRTGLLRRSDGSPLPEATLLPALNRSLRGMLHDFYVAGPRVAPFCAGRWDAVPESLRRAYVRELAERRLLARAERLGRAFGARPELGLLLGQRVFRCLGYRPNADAMERLYSRLPWGAVHALTDPADLTAMLMGMAGLLTPNLLDTDESSRFDQLRASFDLPAPMRPEAWRSGVRPANAPRRRLTQAAAMLAPGGPLRGPAPLDRIRACLGARDPVGELRTLLRPTDASTPAVGRDRFERIVVDAVVPVLLLDGQVRGDAQQHERAVGLLARLRPPSDAVTRAFRDAGLASTSALEAQGMYELDASFCQEQRCARCRIGKTLLERPR